MKLNFEKYLHHFTNNKGLVIILLIGVALVMLPDLFPKSQTQQSIGAQHLDRRTYEKELENRLSEMLATVSGINHVSVMITLEDTGEIFYAQTETYDEENTNDDARVEKKRQSEGTPTLKNDSGGGQSPILLKTGLPKISGVLVTAKGVENPALQASVISAVCAVLHVAPNRVQVLCKN